MVSLVNVSNRTPTSLTLSWNTEEDKDWTYILDINGKKLPDASRRGIVDIQIESLRPGTEYPFSVTTEFYGLNSTAYKNFTVTSKSKKMFCRKFFGCTDIINVNLQ